MRGGSIIIRTDQVAVVHCSDPREGTALFHYPLFVPRGYPSLFERSDHLWEGRGRLFTEFGQGPEGGTDEVVVSRNADEMKKHTGSFDFILDTISADHDINAYINLLGRDGNLTLVGAPSMPLAVSSFGLLPGRRSLSGSPIGGLPETQEMLDFCGAHDRRSRSPWGPRESSKTQTSTH